MQNIDPVYILQPLILIGFSVGTVLYWHRRKGFSRYVLGFSLLAYGGAIAVKLVFQYLTAPTFLSISGGSVWLLGAYFGLQTAVFEVGGAFLVASLAVSRRKMKRRDGVAYGLWLAFWENAVLIGGSSAVSLLYYFFTISQGGPPAQGLSSLLSNAQPQLFFPPLEALEVIGWALLERVSSLMVHLSWGYLCVKSAASHRKRYFLLAFPMGLIDFLVPFARIMTLPLFELVLFMLAAFCILATVYATRTLRK